MGLGREGVWAFGFEKDCGLESGPGLQASDFYGFSAFWPFGLNLRALGPEDLRLGVSGFQLRVWNLPQTPFTCTVLEANYYLQQPRLETPKPRKP